ncbi:MAG: hypothetical protein KDJ63_07445 [Nitratireductor sp.]|nr:hypothetical protein [Nitratireductor sp.]
MFFARSAAISKAELLFRLFGNTVEFKLIVAMKTVMAAIFAFHFLVALPISPAQSEMLDAFNEATISTRKIAVSWRIIPSIRIKF